MDDPDRSLDGELSYLNFHRYVLCTEIRKYLCHYCYVFEQPWLISVHPVFIRIILHVSQSRAFILHCLRVFAKTRFSRFISALGYCGSSKATNMHYLGKLVSLLPKAISGW